MRVGRGDIQVNYQPISRGGEWFYETNQNQPTALIKCLRTSAGKLMRTR